MTTTEKCWQHRTVPPAETIARLDAVREVVGITRVADLTGLDRIGIPVFQAVRPLGLLLTVAQGKGATPDAARASAMMEATECWHAEQSDLRGPVCTRAALGNRRHIDPKLVCRQDHVGPVADKPLIWTEAEDLSTGDRVLVPRDVAQLDFTRDADPPWVLRNTNGLAGGNTMAEALCSALAELVERACRVEAERFAPQALAARRLCPLRLAEDSQVVADLLQPISAAGLELDLFDLTNDLGITTIRAQLYDCHASRPVHHPALGHGAHLDPVTAVTRAVTEAVQTRMTYISGNRDDLDPRYYLPSLLTNLALQMDQHMDAGRQARILDLTDHSTSSPEGDLAEMLRRVDAQNRGPVLALDLTRKELGIPVVKLLGPQLVQPGKGRA